MVFKSDKQRIGFFSNRGFTRNQLKPLIRNQPRKQITSINMGKFKRSRTITRPGGKPTRFRFRTLSKNTKVRLGFKNNKVTEVTIFKRKKSDGKTSSNITAFETKRFRNLLVTLFGFAIALSILRRFRQ